MVALAGGVGAARFLRGLVGARAESWYDTAAAARSVAEGDSSEVAAICSAEAARDLCTTARILRYKAGHLGIDWKTYRRAR